MVRAKFRAQYFARVGNQLIFVVSGHRAMEALPFRCNCYMTISRADIEIDSWESTQPNCVPQGILSPMKRINNSRGFLTSHLILQGNNVNFTSLLQINDLLRVVVANHTPQRCTLEERESTGIKINGIFAGLR